MQAVLWMWPAMYRSIYGRFLLLQLDSASIVAVLSVLLSILSVASRLCSRKARRRCLDAAKPPEIVRHQVHPSIWIASKHEPSKHATLLPCS